MKIIRTISGSDPSKCHMRAVGLFGNTKGEVKHFHNNVRDWYAIVIAGEKRGEATDFMHACSIFLDELGVTKTVCV
jgi:hypothetical protein